MLLNIDILKISKIAGWVLLIIFVFAIIYRRILSKLKQGRIEKELYFVLHPLDKNPATGEVQIYVEMHNPIEIEISVISIDNQEERVLEKKTYKKGGNIINLDTRELENGFYFYQAKSDNQKTRKKFEVRN